MKVKVPLKGLYPGLKVYHPDRKDQYGIVRKPINPNAKGNCHGVTFFNKKYKTRLDFIFCKSSELYMDLLEPKFDINRTIEDLNKLEQKCKNL